MAQHRDFSNNPFQSYSSDRMILGPQIRTITDANYDQYLDQIDAAQGAAAPIQTDPGVLTRDGTFNGLEVVSAGINPVFLTIEYVNGYGGKPIYRTQQYLLGLRYTLFGRRIMATGSSLGVTINLFVGA